MANAYELPHINRKANVVIIRAKAADNCPEFFKHAPGRAASDWTRAGQLTTLAQIAAVHYGDAHAYFP